MKTPKNWKTTLFGIGGALCYLGAKLFQGEPITVEDVTIALGMAGIGLMAKDHNVTGGKIQQ